MLLQKDIRTLYKTKPRRKKIKVKVHYTGQRWAWLDWTKLKSKLERS
jgi:hypothetical protein